MLTKLSVCESILSFTLRYWSNLFLSATHLLINFKEASTFRVAARRFYAATAAGSSVRFMKRHKEVIDFVFDKSKNNQIKN